MRDAPARTKSHSCNISLVCLSTSASALGCLSLGRTCSVRQSPCCDCMRGLIAHVKLTNCTAFLFLGQPARRCSPLVPSPTRRTSASPRSLQVHADPRVYLTIPSHRLDISFLFVLCAASSFPSEHCRTRYIKIYTRLQLTKRARRIKHQGLKEVYDTVKSQAWPESEVSLLIGVAVLVRWCRTYGKKVHGGARAGYVPLAWTTYRRPLRFDRYRPASTSSPCRG
jgi:hypothetical protein